MIRSVFLQATRAIYEQVARPIMFNRLTAKEAHSQAMRMCAWFDERPLVLEKLRQFTLSDCPVTVGGVKLPTPLMLAAGFVKGVGFDNENTAIAAVERGENIIPGWRSLTAITGAVEFGSFTRYARCGNDGTVLWRNVGGTRSLQNRIGLRNPGAKAAALFLAAHPPQGMFGINIAVSPGVSDPNQETREVLESIAFFLDSGVQPAWFTLNLSCPNTEADPVGNQTEDKASHLCQAIIEQIEGIPLWVKISPNLSAAQCGGLMKAFDETGVRAVIATNTSPQPTPEGVNIAGVSGQLLFEAAMDTVKMLLCEKQKRPSGVDIIACGGIMDGATYHAYRQLGVLAVQYWSALIYRGPLAAALMLDEAEMLLNI